MATAPLSNLTALWNAAGTTFTAIKMNVTDTASAAGSLLMDLQVGGSSQFSVTKAGVASVSSTLELGHASDTTLSRSSAGVLAVEGVVVPTISSTNTLTNKTLSSPTVSGTIAGAASWSGTQTFGVGTGFPFVRIDGGSSTNNGAALVGRAAGVDQWVVGSYSGIVGGAYDADFTIYNAINSGKAYIYDAGNKRQIVTTTASETLSNKTLSGVTIADATDIALATGTGTKIGTATTQKLGFFNKAPVVQPTAVANATDAASVITQLNALLSRMRDLGLIAT